MASIRSDNANEDAETFSPDVVSLVGDCGPKKSILMKAFAVARETKKHIIEDVWKLPPIAVLKISNLTMSIESTLSFLMKRVKKLLVLVDRTTIDAALTRQAVSVWIHTTMKVEGEEISQEDTLKVILHNLEPDTDKRKLVTNMFALLQDEYKKKKQLSDCDITVERLKAWHTTMFEGIRNFQRRSIPVGEFRTVGVGNAKYHFPHHIVAKEAIPFLCQATTAYVAQQKSLRKNENIADQTNEAIAKARCMRTLEAFTLAAFAQFHFVDLHPFEDGNGRMCRYISKYILDCCLPLPFPMYTDRTKYINALTGGRDRLALHAHIDLLVLSLDSAIAYYTQLAKYSNTPFALGSSSDELVTMLKSQPTCTLSGDDEETIRAKFETLELFVTTTVVVNNRSYSITKMPTLEDSLTNAENLGIVSSESVTEEDLKDL